jgi:hypothetical protein
MSKQIYRGVYVGQKNGFHMVRMEGLGMSFAFNKHERPPSFGFFGIGSKADQFCHLCTEEEYKAQAPQFTADQVKAVIRDLMQIVGDHRPDDKAYLKAYPELDQQIDQALEDGEKVISFLNTVTF